MRPFIDQNDRYSYEDSMNEMGADEGLPELPPMGHPLQKLGARLGELLDEDHWAECERLLLEGWAHDVIDRKTGRHWRQHLTMGQITTLLVKDRIRDLAAAIDRLTSLQTSTGEPASGPTGAHTYLVWCPSYGQSEADGREFTAETPRRAAQGWAWWHDQDSDKYRIVRGTPAVIVVKRLDTDTTTQWTVQGRSLREYVATAHDATTRSAP